MSASRARRFEGRGVAVQLEEAEDRARYEQLRDQLFETNNELAVLARELARTKAELAKALRDLRESHWYLSKIHEVLPICVGCGDVRTAANGTEWETLTRYLRSADLRFSHGYCPACEAATCR